MKLTHELLVSAGFSKRIYKGSPYYSNKERCLFVNVREEEFFSHGGIQLRTLEDLIKTLVTESVEAAYNDCRSYE